MLDNNLDETSSVEETPATFEANYIADANSTTCQTNSSRKDHHTSSAIGDNSRKQFQACRYSTYGYSGWWRLGENIHSQELGGRRKVFWA